MFIVLASGFSERIRQMMKSLMLSSLLPGKSQIFKNYSIYFYYFLCVSILPECTSVYHMLAWCPRMW